MNPCSVEIWEDENFQDNTDVIVGPLESTSMKDLPGADKRDWSDEIDSLRVGPKATVTVWQDPEYREAYQQHGKAESSRQARFRRRDQLTENHLRAVIVSERFTTSQLDLQLRSRL